jgi:hypothetical protein
MVTDALHAALVEHVKQFGSVVHVENFLFGTMNCPIFTLSEPVVLNGQEYWSGSISSYWSGYLSDSNEYFDSITRVELSTCRGEEAILSELSALILKTRVYEAIIYLSLLIIFWNHCGHRLWNKLNHLLFQNGFVHFGRHMLNSWVLAFACLTLY